MTTPEQTALALVAAYLAEDGAGIRALVAAYAEDTGGVPGPLVYELTRYAAMMTAAAVGPDVAPRLLRGLLLAEQEDDG